MTIIVRIIFYLLMPLGLSFGDAEQYKNIAKNFANGKGMFNDYILPLTNSPNEHYIHNRNIGYVIFVAALYKVFGTSDNVVYTAQSILDVLICIFIFFICLNIGLNFFYAFFASVIYALYPINAVFSFMILAETLFTFLSVLLIFILIKSDDYNFFKYLAAALVTGWAILTRPSLEYYPFFIFIYFCREIYLNRGDKFKKIVYSASIYFISVIIIISIWIYRNYKLFGIPFLAFGGGWTLYESNNEKATGGPATIELPLQKYQKTMPYLQQDGFYKAAAIKWIKSHPKRFVELMIIKFFRFWNIVPNYTRFSSFPLNYLSGLFHIIIYFLALTAVIINFKKIMFDKTFLLLTYIIYFTLLHIVFLGSLRYRAPVMPFVFIFSAVGLKIIVEKYIKLRIRRVVKI